MDFVLGIVVGIAVAAVAVYWIVKYMERELLKTLAQLEADADASAESNTVVATVEVVDDRYFCYEKSTNQFICYGNTVADIRDSFLKRFPNRGLTLVSEDPAVLAQLEQQISPKNTAI
jgi:hypothetical protein